MMKSDRFTALLALGAWVIAAVLLLGYLTGLMP